MVGDLPRTRGQRKTSTHHSEKQTHPSCGELTSRSEEEMCHLCGDLPLPSHCRTTNCGELTSQFRSSQCRTTNCEELPSTCCSANESHQPTLNFLHQIAGAIGATVTV